MSGALTYRASSCPTVPADNFEWVFWVDLVSLRDELATGMIGTEYSGFPWCTEL